MITSGTGKYKKNDSRTRSVQRRRGNVHLQYGSARGRICRTHNQTDVNATLGTGQFDDAEICGGVTREDRHILFILLRLFECSLEFGISLQLNMLLAAEMSRPYGKKYNLLA